MQLFTKDLGMSKIDAIFQSVEQKVRNVMLLVHKISKMFSELR